MFAIVPAAGSGSRMGLAGNTSKVLISIESGECSAAADTVLAKTLHALAASGALRGIAIACRAEDVSAIEEIAAHVPPELEVLVVQGGHTRQESVYQCLAALEGKATYVLVHDAARPFCPPQLIAEAARIGRESGACIVAVPSKCTLKRVEAQTIVETVPRAQIWEAQTPQVFSYALLRKAHEHARAHAYTGTDDSELVERIGEQVRIVPGADSNLKITTPHDLEYAAALLR